MHKAFGLRMWTMKAKSVALAIAVLGSFAFVPSSRAQITGVGNDQAPPTPGVGHDYIHFLTETVNPANGSLSVRVEVPVPKGRGLTIPFAFAYDSNGIRFPQSAVPGAILWETSNSYLSQGGWSYSFPNLTMSLGTFQQSQGIYEYQCPYSTAYIFHDATGSAHALRMSSWQAPVTQCELMNSPPQNVLNGGDGFVYANSPSAVTYQGGGITPVTLEDLDGTVYYFPITGGLKYSTGGSQGTTLPAWIEDRNGNQVLISDNGGGAITITDTAGRPALKSSGFGASGNTLAVAGLANPYTLTWGSSAYNFTVPFVEVSVNTCGTAKQLAGGSYPTLQTLELPNGQSYKFYYEATYGLINEIVYPSGGWVKYTWGMNPTANIALFPNASGNQDACAYQYGQPVVTKRQISYDGTTIAEEQDFITYGTSWNVTNKENWTAKNTTVTTKDLVLGSSFNTAYVYSPVNVGNNDPTSSSLFAPQGPVESQVSYFDWNGSLLRTVNETWNSVFELATKKVTLNDISPSLTSEVAYSYVAPDEALVTEKDEYDYGQSTPTRKTVTNYASFAATPIYPSPPSIQDRPSSVQVYGNGTLIAETDYSYDGPAITPVTAYAHDDAKYPASYTNRGNATTTTHKCLQSCANAVSVYTYDQTGQVLSFKDPNGNTTSYSYVDSYTNGTPPGDTNAYVTQIKRPTATNGVSHISNYSYGYLDGQLAVAKDENSQSTMYSYSDSLDRLTTASYPDGGNATYSYSDAPPSPTITASKLITSSLSLTTITALDGVGHPVGTQLTSDPQGIDYTATTYDGLGNIYTASNPYRSTSDSTYGTTTSQHDALSRTKLVTKQDGSKITTSYSGNCATVTDEAGKTRESCADGLGRMTEVIENPGGLGYVTNYTYDALDDLTTVLQAGSRKRSFIYDSLKRLTSSANPETGGTSNPVLYTYDANGNVLTKTDARGIKITYAWDALNRMNQRTYSNGDHYVGYGYDSATCVVVSTCYNIGHMTSMTDAAGTESWAYDQMGRLLGDQRTTNSMTKNAGYVYYLDGSPKTLNYPSGHSVAYTPGGAGLPLSAADSALTSSAYASSGGYTAWGARNGTTYGGNISENILFNTRLQPCWTYASTSALTATSCTATVTAGTFMDVKYNFNLGADNGDLVGITNNRNTNRSQSYSYDAVNRITGAATLSACTANCWHLAYGIDEWANLTGVSGTGNATFSPNANNQIGAAGFTYDVSGNELTDVTSTYAWSAESQMKTGGGVTYLYDGQGNRVEKSGTKLYWYGQNGQVLDETDTTGTTANAAFSEYIYFAGARIARRDYLNNVYYYFEDQVNSSRVIAEIPSGSTTATLCYDADFYPYGGEVDFTSTCAQNYKFQGKERDTETNNDYFGARFYSSAYGRFLSPDWSSVVAPVPYANLTNPQTLNLYAFVSDNPESFADLDGHDPASCAEATSSGKSGPANGSCIAPPQGYQDKSNPANQSNLTTPTESPDQVQQQTYAAMAQQQAAQLAQLSAQTFAPPVGSTDYLSALSGQVNAEMHAGNQLILGFTLLEGAGLVTVAATGPVAAAIGETVVNTASTTTLAVQNVTLRAAAAVDLAVPGGVIATQQFVQAAISPASAKPTNAGYWGVVANFAYKAVKNIF
jgi:RHS repeat-associated protein